MRRIPVGAVAGRNQVTGELILAKPTDMLKGQVQAKPIRRFKAILSIVGDTKSAVRYMNELELWAKDDDGVMDQPGHQWITRHADAIIDGDEEPPAQDVKAMRKILDGHRANQLAEAVSSAARLSISMDERVLNKEAQALDAKYAGDKLGWLYRADPPATKQAIINQGNFFLNAGEPPKRTGLKPPRIDKKQTKRLAKIIDVKATVVK
jgi:hypothetical protein